jgi:hypothetical protein
MRMNRLWVFVMVAFALMGAATMNVTTDSTARVGQSIGVKIQVDDGVNPIGNLSCTVYTSSNGRDIIDLYAYEENLNQPPTLKTNAGGYAFINIPIDIKYPVGWTYTTHAYCGNQTGSSTFTTDSFDPSVSLWNAITSLSNNPIAWVIGIIFLIIIVGVIKIILKVKL